MQTYEWVNDWMDGWIDDGWMDKRVWMNGWITYWWIEDLIEWTSGMEWMND